MPRIVEAYAVAEWKSCREEIRDESSKVVAISNEGQSCVTLVPRWANWGRTLEDGVTQLEPGKTYKISIEIEE